MPPQNKPSPRTCRIEVQFSKEEKLLAEQLAEKLGVPLASVVRLAFKAWAEKTLAAVA